MERVHVCLGIEVVASRVAGIAEANLCTTATFHTRTFASTTGWKDLITYATKSTVNQLPAAKFSDW